MRILQLHTVRRNTLPLHGLPRLENLAFITDIPLADKRKPHMRNGGNIRLSHRAASGNFRGNATVEKITVDVGQTV